MANAVNISGTFKKDTRPNNGLEAIAEELVRDELTRHVIVGLIELHRVVKDPGEAPRPTVRFVAIEPLREEDAAEQGRQMLNQARNARGLSLVPEDLFDMPADDEPTTPAAGAPVEGQEELPITDDDGPNSDRVHDEWLDKDAR